MGGFVSAIAPFVTGAATGGTSLLPALITAGATLGSTLLARAMTPDAPTAPDPAQITFPTSEVPQITADPNAVNPDQVAMEEADRVRALKRRQSSQVRGGGLLNNAPTEVKTNTLLGG